MKRLETYTITATLTLLSGCRIGGSDDILQIGGTDLTCIKDPATGKPYIPGSSLKGKMRAMLERATGTNEGENPSRRGPIARVFGAHGNDKADGPTRIRVHDAPMADGQIPVLELKTESINLRESGVAKHPRTLERVAPGAKFNLRIDFDVYEMDASFTYKTFKSAEAIYEIIMDGLDLLCQTGIGSGTSRGYGQIEITDDKLTSPKPRPRLKFSDAGATT